MSRSITRVIPALAACFGVLASSVDSGLVAQSERLDAHDEGGGVYHEAAASELDGLLGRALRSLHVCQDDPDAQPEVTMAFRIAPSHWLFTVETHCFATSGRITHVLFADDRSVRPVRYATAWAPRRATPRGRFFTPWREGDQNGAWLYQVGNRIRLRAVDCGRVACDTGVLDTYEWRRGVFVQLTRRARDAYYQSGVQDGIEQQSHWAIEEPRAKRCGVRLTLRASEGVLESVGPRGVIAASPFPVVGGACTERTSGTLLCEGAVEYQALGDGEDWVVYRVAASGGSVQVTRMPRGCSLEDV